MLIEIGHFALVLALIFSILLVVLPSIGIYQNKSSLAQLSKPLVWGQCFWIIVAFLVLMNAFLTNDFSVKYVAENSNTQLPILYKASAVWGAHEGSLLLWVFILSLWSIAVSIFSKQIPSNLLNLILIVLGAVSFGFLLFLLYTSNPFERLMIPPLEGRELNPLLQDFGLAVHPPMLYMGYVGLSVPFAFVISALIRGQLDSSWLRWTRPWTLISWAFLTVGIILGSWWAYYELGWGGWWFWDPVENASFMPWLLGTALLHSLIIVEKRKSLQAWVLLLSILAFLLSVVGTFLVRSGILTSVHTFALDPSRGIYILAFTALLGGYSLILFGAKSKKYFDNNYFTFFSKEGSILINNILMVVVCSTVFLGTIYPLLVEALTNNKISVGEPYYNSTVIPIMIPAILVMGIGPILSWGKEDKSKTFKKILPSILLTTILTIFIFLIYQSYSIVGIAGIILAFWIISNNLLILIKKNKNYSIGMIIAHLGIGLLILGITGSSVWQEEKITRMKIDSETKIEKYNIVFEKINEIRGPNYVALQGNFLVYDEKRQIISRLKPENRFYPITNNFTTEASIHTNLFRDLYIVLGEGNLNDGWVVRIYYNPLVIWIWIGSLVIFIGGIVSMNINLRKLKIL